MSNLVQTLSSIRISLANIITEIDKALAPTPVISQDLLTEINKGFNALCIPNKDKNVISGYFHPLKWTRNSNCWASSLDLSGMSVGIFGLGGVGGGTLITRKHVLLANHVPYPALPASIYFVNKNSISFEYKIVQTKRIGTTDLLIGELDQLADSSLAVYSVMPANFEKYFKPQPISNQPRFPLFYSDQEKKMLTADYVATYNNTLTEKVAQIAPPTDANRLPYFEIVIGGDSGNAVGTIINNEIVLLGGWYMTLASNGGVSTIIPRYIEEINSVIASFGSTLRIKEYNLSAFKQY
jgi:hypothetical protein